MNNALVPADIPATLGHYDVQPLQNGWGMLNPVGQGGFRDLFDSLNKNMTQLPQQINPQTILIATHVYTAYSELLELTNLTRLFGMKVLPPNVTRIMQYSIVLRGNLAVDKAERTPTFFTSYREEANMQGVTAQGLGAELADTWATDPRSLAIGLIQLSHLVQSMLVSVVFKTYLAILALPDMIQMYAAGHPNAAVNFIGVDELLAQRAQLCAVWHRPPSAYTRFFDTLTALFSYNNISYDTLVLSSRVINFLSTTKYLSERIHIGDAENLAVRLLRLGLYNMAAQNRNLFSKAVLDGARSFSNLQIEQIPSFSIINRQRIDLLLTHDLCGTTSLAYDEAWNDSQTLPMPYHSNEMEIWIVDRERHCLRAVSLTTMVAASGIGTNAFDRYFDQSIGYQWLSGKKNPRPGQQNHQRMIELLAAIFSRMPTTYSDDGNITTIFGNDQNTFMSYWNPNYSLRHNQIQNLDPRKRSQLEELERWFNYVFISAVANMFGTGSVLATDEERQRRYDTLRSDRQQFQQLQNAYVSFHNHFFGENIQFQQDNNGRPVFNIVNVRQIFLDSYTSVIVNHLLWKKHVQYNLPLPYAFLVSFVNQRNIVTRAIAMSGDGKSVTIFIGQPTVRATKGADTMIRVEKEQRYATIFKTPENTHTIYNITGDMILQVNGGTSFDFFDPNNADHIEGYAPEDPAFFGPNQLGQTNGMHVFAVPITDVKTLLARRHYVSTNGMLPRTFREQSTVFSPQIIFPTLSIYDQLWGFTQRSNAGDPVDIMARNMYPIPTTVLWWGLTHRKTRALGNSRVLRLETGPFAGLGEAGNNTDNKLSHRYAINMNASAAFLPIVI